MTTTSTQLTGKVKWFNNKAGFGFITVCDAGDLDNKDIFVHYSSIQVQNSQYKYLVQGEYVDFYLSKPNTGEHEYHAVNVCGIKGGSLMCETRKQNGVNRMGGTSVGENNDNKDTISRVVSREMKNRPERRTVPALNTDAEFPAKEATPAEEDGYKRVSHRRDIVTKADTKTPRNLHNQDTEFKMSCVL
jgi:CspA family cold shock protein